jgi:2-isopropylmalate synthase
VIRINSQSGKSGIAHVLERDYGLRLPRALAVDLSREVQIRTDASGEEYSAEATLSLFRSSYVDAPGPLVFDGAGVDRQREGSRCEVTAHLKYADIAQEARGTGAGPIEAFIQLLSKCVGTALEISDYSEHGASEGASARAVAYVALRADGHTRYGVGEHEDVVIASFRAIVSAYNRLRG